MSTENRPRPADRVESYIATVEAYEPTLMAAHAELFRAFARYLSRSLDSRHLESQPATELLPDLERWMQLVLVRGADELKVQLVSTGEGSERRAVLTTNMLDQLFIYSTVRQALDQLGIKIFRSVSSVMPMQRDTNGVISAIGRADSPKESIIWLEVEGEGIAGRTAEIESTVRGRLGALRAVVADFEPMRHALETTAARLEALGRQHPDQAKNYDDNARFLRWMLDEHFVLLGTRFVPHPSAKAAAEVYKNLGVGRFDDARGIAIPEAERALLEQRGPEKLWLAKSATRAWLYRPGHLDHILVHALSERGEVLGLYVIEGLFSFRASAEPRTDVPMLDRMIEHLYATLDAARGSHRYRTIRNAFNSLPLDCLFTLKRDDVREIVSRVLETDADRRLRLHITFDPRHASAFAFIALPRSHYSEELRTEVRKLVRETFRAAGVDDGVYTGGAELATFHFYLTGAHGIDADTERKLLADIEQLASPWTERLYDELAKRRGVGEARRLHVLYDEAFPARYQEETSIARAVTDIELLEGLSVAAPFDCDVYRERLDEPTGITRLRLYESQNILLSNILPILDNFGLVIIDQFPATVHVPGRNEQVVATFRVSGVEEMRLDLVTRRNRLRDALRAVVAGAMDNDALNRLLLRADIPWTYVALMRSYAHYLKQIGFTADDAAVRDILLRNAEVVKALTEIFRAKFDPDYEGMAADAVDDKRRELVSRAQRTFETLLEGVSDLTSDQVLRALGNLIDATVRTNFYARDPWKDFAVVVKLEPARITRMPDPRPYREILVYHPLVMGLHLRGGPVARGGLRWSDRPADYRTEVLGLMATQNLKNVLIVPRGAKGAFVLKRPSADVATRKAEADAMYKIFVSGLLDVTDNLVGSEKVTPRRVLAWDDKDHYLVVAADKGTAHLSDTANGIAKERGFWLGDAFASGGSKGYDHKKEAITAKGGWECVKRHFQELGVDCEKDRIRVAGIGDMSGDVFGNGMLLSSEMQLVAAFDHRHIFIDPTPDPKKSFAARQKLFSKPGSSWEDYPKEALSAGSGVYPRRAKAVKLSPEAKALLGAREDTLSGPEVVQAILRLDVDLLWNGGIGTYIKASTETHVDVGDTMNDSVRVDATEVRAKVIGEGGNLGITQQGRIELASRGVRLNTDALDNSGGVDMSDHEVNLKILFQRPVAAGRMSLDERDRWLEQVKPEVTRQVLDNNWVQSRMISMDELRSKREPARFQRTLAFLSERVPFKRRDMRLPPDHLLQQRAQRGEGLYRPELAVLAQNAKQDMRQELMKADGLGLAMLMDELTGYFPAPVVEKLGDDVRGHALGINIARTILTNRIIGDAGATWLAEATLRTGRSTSDIVLAYKDASRILGASAAKAELGKLEGKLKLDLEYRARMLLEEGIERLTHWLLRRPEPAGKAFEQALERLVTQQVETASTSKEASCNVLAHELTAAGLPAALATRIATVAGVDTLLDAAVVVERAKCDAERATTALRLVGSSTGMDVVVREPAHTPGAGADDVSSPAHFVLRDRLRGYMVDLACAVLSREARLEAPGPKTTTVLETLRRELAPIASGTISLGSLAMAVDRLERNVATLRND